MPADDGVTDYERNNRLIERAKLVLEQMRASGKVRSLHYETLHGRQRFFDYGFSHVGSDQAEPDAN
jgi:hypothetical protein